MPNSENANRRPTGTSCAWCGADRDVHGQGNGTSGGHTDTNTDTICPRCEADFESLSKSPESARIERKQQSSSNGALAASSWMIRRRRGWVTVWLILMAGLPAVV